MQKRCILMGVAVCVTIMAAVGVGHLLAEQINSRRDAAFKAGREVKTRDLLQRMGTIRSGDVLPDHEFYDSLYRGIRLKDLVDGPTIFSYFDPGCGACIADLICLHEALPNIDATDRIVLLTSSRHTSVNEIQQRTGTRFRVVIDDEERLAQQLSIHTTPFTLLVDSELRIDRIIIGALTEDECEEIADRITEK